MTLRRPAAVVLLLVAAAPSPASAATFTTQNFVVTAPDESADLPAESGADGEPDVGIGPAKPLEPRGQLRARQGPHEGDRDHTPIRSIEPADGLHAVPHRGEQRLGMREEGLSRLGQARPAPRPVEERAAQLPLEEVEPPADRGLGEVKGGRRAGETATADDGHEGLDLVDLHGHQHS